MSSYRVPCAMSHELVEIIAKKFPKKYKRSDGSIRISALLFDAGFKVENDGFSRSNGVSVTNDVYIRDNFQPAKAYKTKAVYVGEVRNILWLFDPVTKKPIYTRQKHPLYLLYEQFEVLQPKNIADILKEDVFVDAIDIGDPVVYDRASVE